MRVLHLYAGNLFGGIEAYLLTLARCRHLVPGMEPHFALCFPGRLRDELVAAGAPVHTLGPVRFRRPWTLLRARRRLRALLRAVRFDAAVTHACWPHAAFAPVVRAAGVRLANAVHDLVTGTPWAERWAARTPPAVVLANSRFTAGPAGRLFPGARVEVVHPPVVPAVVADPGAARREVRAGFGTAADAVVILQASRPERWKGQAVHLDALARLAGVSGWEAWFAGGAQKPGEAEYLGELRAAAARGGVAGRVRFLGQRADVPRLLAAADIFCQPNAGPEPFGVGFVEALAAGVPAVGSATGGTVEVVDGTCGVLTPAGDPAAVAAALGGLIRDPGRRRALGAAGPARAAAVSAPGRQLARLAGLLGGAA